MDEEYYKKLMEENELKDTKYWLKKDAEIFKKGINKILKVFGILLSVSLIISLLINYSYDTFSFSQILIMTLYIFPIVLLGFALIYSVVYRGYNIYSESGGTLIDKSGVHDTFKKENKSTPI
jgi:hypothetical protein